MKRIDSEQKLIRNRSNRVEQSFSDGDSDEHLQIPKISNGNTSIQRKSVEVNQILKLANKLKKLNQAKRKAQKSINQLQGQLLKDQYSSSKYKEKSKKEPEKTHLGIVEAKKKANNVHEIIEIIQDEQNQKINNNKFSAQKFNKIKLVPDEQSIKIKLKKQHYQSSEIDNWDIKQSLVPSQHISKYADGQYTQYLDNNRNVNSSTHLKMSMEQQYMSFMKRKDWPAPQPKQKKQNNQEESENKLLLKIKQKLQRYQKGLGSFHQVQQIDEQYQKICKSKITVKNKSMNYYYIKPEQMTMSQWQKYLSIFKNYIDQQGHVRGVIYCSHHQAWNTSKGLCYRCGQLLSQINKHLPQSKQLSQQDFSINRQKYDEWYLLYKYKVGKYQHLPPEFTRKQTKALTILSYKPQYFPPLTWINYIKSNFTNKPKNFNLVNRKYYLCGHLKKKYSCLGYCWSCYELRRQEKNRPINNAIKAYNCQHKNQPLLHSGVCQNCYNKEKSHQLAQMNEGDQEKLLKINIDSDNNENSNESSFDIHQVYWVMKKNNKKVQKQVYSNQSYDRQQLTKQKSKNTNSDQYKPGSEINAEQMINQNQCNNSMSYQESNKSIIFDEKQGNQQYDSQQIIEDQQRERNLEKYWGQQYQAKKEKRQKVGNFIYLQDFVNANEIKSKQIQKYEQDQENKGKQNHLLLNFLQKLRNKLSS